MPGKPDILSLNHREPETDSLPPEKVEKLRRARKVGYQEERTAKESYRQGLLSDKRLRMQM